MKIELLFGALKSIADLFKGWFGRLAVKAKEKKKSVDKTTSGIGNGKPFILLLPILLLFVSCGQILTVSTPMAFDRSEFAYVKKGEAFEVPNDGYYFEKNALEKYIRSKIAEYEIRKKGFYHKEGE